MTEEESSRNCPNCGNVYPASLTECPRCGSSGTSFFFSISWETVLTLSGIILVVFFFVTGFLTKMYHQKLDALSAELYAEGEQHLKSGDAGAAMANFRDALVYTPDDFQIQFQLAQALAAAGRDAEAGAYLQGLLTRSPSDAAINLALARIAAAQGSETDALRYYHGAIFGIWPSEPLQNRLKARLELCHFLIGRKDNSSAEAELIALASELPLNNASLHAQTAEMFESVGDQKKALDEYRRALDAEPTLEEALRGAGLIEYATGDFREAERYLARAHNENRSDAEIATKLEMSRLILAADPSAPELNEKERRKRIRADFHQAESRLESCAKTQGVDLFAKAPPQSDFDKMYARAKVAESGLTDRALRLHPEGLDAAMKLAFTMEDFAAEKCGAPQGADQALLMLSKYQSGGNQ